MTPLARELWRLATIVLFIAIVLGAAHALRGCLTAPDPEVRRGE